MPYAPGQLRFENDRPTRKQREKVRKHTYDAQRGTSAQRGYTSKWRQARVGFLAKHPLCCQCGEAGQVVPATVVDHIVPHRGDRALFWDRQNWQPLCQMHHDRKTAMEDSAFAGGGGL